MTKKVLITDDVHENLIFGLQKCGFLVDYKPDISLAEVHDNITPYTGLVINSKVKVDKVMLDNASNLRFIARLGSGLDIIDLEYAAVKGVTVLSAPEGNCNAVAEHALGMLLALCNNLCRADAEVRKKLWHREKNRGIELMQRTIGIIGYGHTGSAFAQKLSSLCQTILVYDKYKEHYANAMRCIHETDLNTIQHQADIISLHLPLTDETYHLVNCDFIAACKPGVMLVNTSRGHVIDTPALLDGLESGHIGGACLDVFENEKTATFSPQEEQLYERLYQRSDVILSPHIAGWTVESKQRIADVLLAKIRLV